MWLTNYLEIWQTHYYKIAKVKKKIIKSYNKKLINHLWYPIVNIISTEKDQHNSAYRTNSN